MFLTRISGNEEKTNTYTQQIATFKVGRRLAKHHAPTRTSFYTTSERAELGNVLIGDSEGCGRHAASKRRIEGGMCWLVLSCAGLCWHWHGLACLGLCWVVLTCTGLCKLVLEGADVRWFVLACVGLCWLVLAQGCLCDFRCNNSLKPIVTKNYSPIEYDLVDGELRATTQEVHRWCPDEVFIKIYKHDFPTQRLR